MNSSCFTTSLLSHQSFFHDNNLSNNFGALDLSNKLLYAYLNLYQSLISIQKQSKCKYNYYLKWNSILKHRIISGKYKNILSFCQDITALLYSLFDGSPKNTVYISKILADFSSVLISLGIKSNCNDDFLPESPIELPPFENISVLSELDPHTPSNIPLSLTQTCEKYNTVIPFHQSFISPKTYLKLRCIDTIKKSLENQQIDNFREKIEVNKPEYINITPNHPIRIPSEFYNIPLSCKLCHYKTLHLYNLVKHKLTHPYETITILNDHFSSHITFNHFKLESLSPDRIYHCNIYKCPYQTYIKYKIKQHYKIHELLLSNDNSFRVEIYTCPYQNCGFISVSKILLSSHIKSHNPILHDPYKSLDTEIDFITVHYNEKEFPCPFSNCYYSTNNLSILINHHLSKHTIGNNSKCDDIFKNGSIICPFDKCNYIIKSLNYLKLHIQTHYSKMYYKCFDYYNCGYISMSRCSMYYHICIFHSTHNNNNNNNTFLSNNNNNNNNNNNVPIEEYKFCSYFNCDFKCRSQDIIQRHISYHSNKSDYIYKCKKHCCFYLTNNRYRFYVHNVKKHGKNHLPYRARRYFSINPDILPVKHVIYRNINSNCNNLNNDIEDIEDAEDNIYNCQFCEFVSNSNETLLRHQIIHNIYKCWFKNCSYNTKEFEQFRFHLSSKHNFRIQLEEKIQQLRSSKDTNIINKNNIVKPILYNPYNDSDENEDSNINSYIKPNDFIVIDVDDDDGSTTEEDENDYGIEDINRKYQTNNYNDDNDIILPIKRPYEKSYKYRCNIEHCYYKTNSKVLFTRHKKSHFSYIYYQCSIFGCSFRCIYYNQFYYHYLRNHGDNVPALVALKNTYVNYNNYYNKFYIKYNNNNNNNNNRYNEIYHCEYNDCKYKTNSKTQLFHHLLYIHRMKEYKCNYPNCDFVTKYSKILRYHINHHHLLKEDEMEIENDENGKKYDDNNDDFDNEDIEVIETEESKQKHKHKHHNHHHRRISKKKRK